MELKEWQKEIGRVQRKAGHTYFVNQEGQVIESNQTDPAAKLYQKQKVRKKLAEKKEKVRSEAEKINQKVQRKIAKRTALIAKLESEVKALGA